MKFGFIGTNFITEEFIKAGRRVEGFEAYAVCSRTQERADAFAAAQGIPKAVSSLPALAGLEDLGAVHIATPNICHFPQTQQMLLSGRNVLVEKPAMVTAEQFSQLVTLAKEQNLVLMEGMRTVHTPGFRAIQQALPRLGTPRKCSISYCQYSRRYDHYRQGIVENAFNPVFGNGALMDIGAYCFGTLSALFGMPEEILPACCKLDNGLDILGTVICVYDGMLADLSFGKVSETRRKSEIQGEEATITFYPPTNPTEVTLIARDGTEEVLYHSDNTDFFGIDGEIRDFLSFTEDPSGGEWEIYAGYTKDALTMMDTVRTKLGIDFAPRNQEETP